MLLLYSLKSYRLTSNSQRVANWLYDDYDQETAILIAGLEKAKQPNEQKTWQFVLR